MIDTEDYRKTTGVGRNVLEARLGELCTALVRATSKADTAEAYRDLALANLTATQARCTELLLECRELRAHAAAGYVGAPTGAMAWVLCDVVDERERQDARWGPPSAQLGIPDGTGYQPDVDGAASARELCDATTRAGTVTWRDVLAEEVAEAFAESDPARLREELVQISALTIKWVQIIDARTAAAK